MKLTDKINFYEKTSLDILKMFAKNNGLSIVVRTKDCGDFTEFTIFIYDKSVQKRYLVGYDGTFGSHSLNFETCLRQAQNYATRYIEAKSWVCTDPDALQFRKNIDKHTFRFIQVTDELLLERYGGKGMKVFTLLLSRLNKTPKWFVCDVINLNDYTEEEKKSYAFGGILDGVTDEQEKNELIAECIFETDFLNNF